MSNKRIPYLFKENEYSDYLNAAIESATWIQNYEVKEDYGKTWKIFPDNQDGISVGAVVGKKSFYSGSSGIGFFFLRLYQITKDKKWLQEAEEAAIYLLHNSTDVAYYKNIQNKIKEDPSRIYGWSFSYKVGPISEGLFTYALYEETNKEEYLNYAIKVTEDFVEAAIEDEKGIYWSDAQDIVGDAGGIVYLLQMYKRLKKEKYLEVAEKAGEYIETLSRSAKNGGRYYVLYDLEKAHEGEAKSVHVNFSHGSTGIMYVWALLYEATKKTKYLDRAKAIVDYLKGIEARVDDSVLFPYQDHPEKGATYDKFYLGMCGGPVGSSLPFAKLYELTGEDQYLTYVKDLANGLICAGVPEKRSWGYWGSKCICCGGPGVLEYFSWLFEVTKDEKYLQYAKKTADVLLGDSHFESNGKKRCWYGVWDREQPNKIVSYLGFYIGAAGAGASLLRLCATYNNAKVADFFEYI